MGVEPLFNTALEYDKDAPKEINEDRIMMAQVRDELAKYTAEGGQVQDFVKHYLGELQAAHEQWRTAQRMLIDMSREGETPENLRAFRDKANELLSKSGIKQLSVPPSVRRAMGEE